MNAVFKKHLLFLCVAAVYLLVVNVTQIGCPIRYMLGFPCPTCGMTRAMIALMHGDIESYASYHVLALPVCVSTLALLHVRLLQNRVVRGTVCGMAVAVLMANIGFYMYQL